jgi:cytidine deaminase
MKNFILVDHFEDLDAESKYLAHKAKEASTHAYAPYSKFMVGAAALLENGKVVTGCNQENAAYPSGMCAERVALFAVTSQYPDQIITKIAVVAKRKSSKELLPATSCGPCRQVMLEFEARQQSSIQIVMQNKDHQWVVAPSAESLLPFSFSPANLEHHDDTHAG